MSEQDRKPTPDRRPITERHFLDSVEQLLHGWTEKRVEQVTMEIEVHKGMCPGYEMQVGALDELLESYTEEYGIPELEMESAMSVTQRIAFELATEAYKQGLLDGGRLHELLSCGGSVRDLTAGLDDDETPPSGEPDGSIPSGETPPPGEPD